MKIVTKKQHKRVPLGTARVDDNVLKELSLKDNKV